MARHVRFSLRPVPILFGLGLFMCLLSAAAVEPGPEILLWPNGAPGSEGKTGDEKVHIADNGERVLSNFHKPSARALPPPALSGHFLFAVSLCG